MAAYIDVTFSYLKLLKLLSLKLKYIKVRGILSQEVLSVSFIINKINKNYQLKINYPKKKFNETKFLSLNVNKSKNIKLKIN